MALQARFPDFSTRERRPIPGEQEIAALRDTAEIRYIALGPKHYEAARLTKEQVMEVEEELRKARMYEHLVTSKTMRAAELDEQRRRIATELAHERETSAQRTLESQLLRQRALAALHHQAECIRMEESERLEADRRAILQREKERLLEHRRQFEMSYTERFGASGGGDAVGASPSAGSTRAVTPRGTRNASMNSTATANAGQPVCVMSVALGTGRDGRIVVRQYDDPKRVAMLFVKKHKLPEHVIQSLAKQIEANLSTSLRHRAPAPGPNGSSAGRPAGSIGASPLFRSPATGLRAGTPQR